MIDTCQANTMYSKFYSPNIVATGSSELGENSYSVSSSTFDTLHLADVSQHENDNDIGVAVIDSYTHYVLQYLEQINKTSKATMADLVSLVRPNYYFHPVISMLIYPVRIVWKLQSCPNQVSRWSSLRLVQPSTGRDQGHGLFWWGCSGRSS